MNIIVIALIFRDRGNPCRLHQFWRTCPKQQCDYRDAVISGYHSENRHLVDDERVGKRNRKLPGTSLSSGNIRKVPGIVYAE